MVYNYILLGLWAVFLLYWAFSAFGTKRDVKKPGTPWFEVLLRLLLTLVVIWVSRLQSFRQSLGVRDIPPAIIIFGFIICALGIALAIWARRHLGANWSSQPALKENHELVTDGPYKIVRHPIYTGMIVAILGSALTGGLFWLGFFVIMIVIFIRRVKIEEKLMLQQFPNQYPAYKLRTKALVPFVW
ncbi:MAG: isoprenylcysteine carboxylmethyltransferase family protein [Patescibacteria group bacterium]|nr:isoprenylcysteine carboxylmethyltransferase family protein [Patescibacteria group bacterium]